MLLIPNHLQEKELLERKQKQLRERRDREKKREEEEEEARRRAALRIQSGGLDDSSKKKKKRNKKKKGSFDGTEADMGLPDIPDAPSGTFPASQLPDTTLIDTAQGSSPADTTDESRASINRKDVVMLESTDQLFNQLLMMGFTEDNCYAAAQKFGRNLEAALTWLCDRPNGGMPTSKSGPDSNLGRVHDPSVVRASTDAPPDAKPAQSVPSSSKKTSDHNEQLRRINRIWNQNQLHKRVEEEKRAETERRAEIEKLKSSIPNARCVL
jgi:hypothetical protein